MLDALVDLTVLGSYSRRRGIGRYAADLARAIAGTGRVRLRAIEQLGPSGEAHVAEDVAEAVARLLARPVEDPHGHWAWRVRLGLIRAARRTGAALLHSCHPEATPLGDFPGHRVATCHDLIPLRYPQHYVKWRDGFSRGRRWLDARRYTRADHVIAVSRATADDLVRLLSVPARKITVVHNGVDLTRWSPVPSADDAALRASVDVSDGAPYFLYVGAADWRKNVDGMFAALARLRSTEVSLLWAGRLTAIETARVETLAAAHGISHRVRMLGFVPDAVLAALARRAVAELFVSHAEGFGYPVIEAMACGCPVIASRGSSLEEITGDAALQVDPADPGAIADAMDALCTQTTLVQDLRRRGPAHAARFGLTAMAHGTIDVWEHVVRG